MFQEVEGDILLTEAQAIVHGVAPNDDFKHGLAFSLKEKYPKLYKDFRHFSHGNHPKEGSMWTWETEDGKKIFNLFTQEHAKGHGSLPGKATTSYVNHCFKDLKKELQKHGVASIAIPKIATGVGGLEWEDVKPIIEKHLAELNIPIYLYETYRKDQQAEE